MTFVISKVFWIVAAPGNFLLIILLLGTARLLASGGRRGRVPVLLVALAFLAVAALPLAAWVAAPLENRFPMVTALPERVDGIILLGGAVMPKISAERGQVQLNEAAPRVTETVALARRHPEARILITGGDASLVPTGLTEAAPTRDLLVALGVAPERLMIESGSRNTWENATLSYALAKPQAGETWVLVTTAMHMPRAVGCFRRAGWSIIPYPVDYRTEPSVELTPRFGFANGLNAFNLAVQEWIGLIAYELLGRMDTWFPAPSGEAAKGSLQIGSGSG
jgi:uncharacterized SAM-binding protein YcdF (DUF218 family)